jgi:hypothetical protein
MNRKVASGLCILVFGAVASVASAGMIGCSHRTLGAPSGSGDSSPSGNGGDPQPSPSGTPVEPTSGDAPGDAPALTYARDLKSLLDTHCTGCHTKGGIAPFPLTTYEEVKPYAASIKDAVSDRRMPPWLAGPGCNEYKGDPSLSDDEIKRVASWVDLGAPAGDLSNQVAGESPSPHTLTRVDQTLTMPQAYTPQTSPDDYRCFVLDWPETTRQWVTGFRAVPGNASIVHHVIAYVASADDAAAAQKAGADGAPGYQCFGGPGGDIFRWLGAWAPGVGGNDYPDGTGLRVPQGSKIILEVHYNTTNGNGSDQTAIQLSLAENVDKPATIIPWTNPQWVGTDQMKIPAGDPDAVHSFAFDPTPYMAQISGGDVPNGPIVVYGAGFHEHLLGTKGNVSIKRQGGAAECMLDIPRWNFHWQFSYALQQPKRVNAGDQISLECHWDNSGRRIPNKDGTPSTPHDVKWGEGTQDEMCLSVLYVSAP